ncbi:ABC transporter ATP-binding protein [uncultured Paracoccus sp.]|uniref:ABC transporter ATP-binding protein n=1 Tax=uncultured Paracoccus sp. TaxID=189685 RepID=UPI0025F73471|nr:ABC transporter ATP-binding protein [uncultured Paracoccus sp.]
MTPALEIRGLRKSFGGVAATRDVSLVLPRGGRLALIGPNGAGKTTLVNQLTGILRPDAGRVLLGGQDITRMAPAARARLGLGRTFQINQLFASMTPAEALALAISERRREGWRFWRGMGGRDDIAAEVARIAQDFGLADHLDQPSGALSYGRQRLLELAIALAGQPRLLLLDEPAAGVPEHERRDILDSLAALPRDVSIILVEHDMDLVFSFADRIAVMVDGAVFAEGPPQAILDDPRVRAVYLGQGADG